MEREWYQSMCLIYQQIAEEYNVIVLYHIDDAGQLRVMDYEQALAEERSLRDNNSKVV